MYRPSNYPVLAEQQENAARELACSDQRIRNMRRTSAEGRARAFRTIINPGCVANTLGIPAAVNAQILQDQTNLSRGSGLLGTGGAAGNGESEYTAGEIISGAPEVVSLNRGGGCAMTGNYAPVPLPRDQKPGMPHRAPNVVQTPMGPMYVRGASSTIEGDYTDKGETVAGPGLAGIAPPWGDAYLVPEVGAAPAGTWIADHPWLTLLAAAGAVWWLADNNKRGRK